MSQLEQMMSQYRYLKMSSLTRQLGVYNVVSDSLIIFPIPNLTIDPPSLWIFQYKTSHVQTQGLINLVQYHHFRG